MSTPLTTEEFDRRLLDASYEQALKSLEEGGIPIGSALGSPSLGIVAAGHNERIQSGDTTAHAEVVCIRKAGRRRDWPDLTLASTLSPCIMCTGTALLHGIPRVIIGEHETFMGAEDLLASHDVQVRLMNDQRCIDLMRRFIAERSDLWDEDIGTPPSER